MTIRELRNVSTGIMKTAELIVIDNGNKATLSLREYDNYRKYADSEIILLEQGVYTDNHSDNSITVKPKLIIYVYEKGEQND